MRRAAAGVLVAVMALTGCARPPDPAPPAAVREVQAPGPGAAITAARITVAEALTEARITRIDLMTRALAAPEGSPLVPTLVDRIDRLKRLEADAEQAQATLQAARSPDTPAGVARRSVRQAQAAARRLRTLSTRVGQ